MKLFIVIYLYLFVFIAPAIASSDFSTSFISTYSVDADASTLVSHQVTLKNEKPNIFVSEFSIAIGSTNLKNISASDESGILPAAVETENNLTRIRVGLEKSPALGEGQTKKFSIRYLNFDIAASIGNIVEINIPKLSNSRQFKEFETIVSVPVSFGQPSTMIPNPIKISPSAKTVSYTFSRNDGSGISAVFGDNQTYEVKLNYFLENKELSPRIKTVALPPDTAFQKITIKDISPPPIKIDRDADGNWLAVFSLKPNEKIIVSANLMAQIYMRATVPIPAGNPGDYLKPTKYWPADDDEIKSLAENLKTPTAIYTYVVGNLDYDYSKVENSPRRLGAKAALLNPKSSICTEFTDLFIALARAAGIPARELNGFAWTDNPKLRPLSLTSDILHSWPEYWDPDNGRWVQVDPTWGNTTGNIDYFSKLDFNHIVFAIHGSSDTSPLPAGFYKTQADQNKTVEVKPVKSNPDAETWFNAEVEIPAKISSLFPSEIKIRLKNTGAQSIYNLVVAINSAIEWPKINDSIDYLLPLQTTELKFKIKPKNRFNGFKLPVTVTIGDKSYESIVAAGIIPINWPQAIFILAGLPIVLAGIATATWRLRLRK